MQGFASGLAALGTFVGLLSCWAPPEASAAGVAELAPVASPGWLEVFDPDFESVGGFRPLDGPLDPGRPTLLLIHGWNITSDTSLNERGSWTFRALHSSAGDGTSVGKLGARSDLNLLAWNWLEWAKMRLVLGLPDDVVPFEGFWLARALRRELADGYDRPIHLIGHSLGGGVAVWAALCLENLYGVEVDQVTLSDAPELETRLEASIGSLIRIRPLRLDRPIRALARAGVFVDNYPSVFGKAYCGAGVANVLLECELKPRPREFLLQPPDLYLAAFLQKVDDHFYSLAWYFGWRPDEERVNGVALWPRGSPTGTIVDSDPADYVGYPFIAPGVPLESVGAAWSRVLCGEKGGSIEPGSGCWRMKSVEEPYKLVGATPF